MSANFSKELTTSVMWLNERALDIRCIRVTPYQDNGRILIDVQQVIPLPEAAEYQVQLREKEQKGRKGRANSSQYRKFWEGLLALAEGRTKLHANISPSGHDYIATGAGIGALTYNYVIGQQEGRVELYINRKEAMVNKRLFDELYVHKAEIEQAFGEALSWERLDTRKACRIAYYITSGGYRDDEANWQAIQIAMINAMIRLEKALSPFIAILRQGTNQS
jgi:hypothetical protein